MSFGGRIKSMRVARNVVQSDLAMLLGCTHGQIVHFEKDRRFTGAENLTVLSRFFGVSIDYLLTGAILTDGDAAAAAGESNPVRNDELRPAAQIRAMAGQMVQLQGEGVLQALLDARNLITARAKDLIADPNFGGDSHA